MSKIDLTINKEGLLHNIQKAKENNIIIPTIAQMQNPDLIPEKIKAKLSHTGLWDVDPVNLFRISWHNEAKESGGLFQAVPNYVEIPSKLSGVPCRIIAMSGKWFPTGCHKVGASFGCLAPRLVTGQFDATYHHAVWPSTGNYCRGGAFNSKLLACESVAILPQDMSKERFDWLKSIAGQIIATPGCESNVKEIFDKTWELKQDPSMMIFNQFEEMGNPLWHYNVTGYALADLFEAVKKPGQNFAGACFTSGSAGTMSAGDLLKERYPHLKLAVGEALQDRQFNVVTIDNYPSSKVTRTTIYFGVNAINPAYTLNAYFKDAVMVMDNRQDRLVDVVLGATFNDLNKEKEVKKQGDTIKDFKGCKTVDELQKAGLPKASEHTAVN